MHLYSIAQCVCVCVCVSLSLSLSLCLSLSLSPPIDNLILCISVAYAPVATTRYSNLFTSQVSSAFFEQ